MAIAYLKFEDDAADGGVIVAGGLEGAIEPGSAAHMTVLRLSQNVDKLQAFLDALPPFKMPEAPVFDDTEALGI